MCLHREQIAPVAIYGLMETSGPNGSLSEEPSLRRLPPFLVIMTTSIYSVLVLRAMRGIKRGMEELGAVGNKWVFLVALSRKLLLSL